MSASPSLAYTSPRLRPPRRWPTPLALILAALIFSTLSIYLAYHSDSDLEADATTHYLIARYAPHEPVNFVGVWGRPLCTALYALTAHIGTVDQGRFATRLLSLALALATAAVTYFIARGQGLRRPALAVILLLAQPIFFLHSFSELTEIPFAFVLALAFLAYQRGRLILMAIAVSILPLGRPEGFAFILMAAVALIAYRRAACLFILILPFTLWNYAGWYLTSPDLTHLQWHQFLINPDWWRWVYRNNPYSLNSMYGRGYLVAYIGRLPVLTSPFIFPFMLVGSARALTALPQFIRQRTRATKRRSDEATKGNSKQVRPSFPPSSPFVASSLNPSVAHLSLLTLFIPWFILCFHSLLWWKGKMGSSGDLRYILIVGPFFALLAAQGWEHTWSRLHWRAPLFFAGLAALLPALENKRWQVLPFPLYEDGYVARQAAAWYQSDPQIQKDFPKIMPTPPGIPYAMDVNLNDNTKAVPACKATVSNPPNGALLVWDPVFGAHNSSSDMCVDEPLIHANGWVHYKHFQAGDSYCDVYLSPKTITGQPTKSRYKSDWDYFNLPTP